MFLREQPGLELAGGAGSFGRALVPVKSLSHYDRLRAALLGVDWVPDLGAEIGSLTWWRGLATCTVLCGAAILTAPGIRPVPGHVSTALAGAAW